MDHASTIPISVSDITVMSRDGLKLHVRCHEPRPPHRALPVVCLPGLTRTADDFEILAQALASDIRTPRRVLALDYRGRGRSDYDPDPANYSLPVELADVLTVLAALRAEPAVIVGTSRGGLLAMLLASARPDAVAAVVLNDIGPVIETAGLLRIKSYVGAGEPPKTIMEAAEGLRALFADQFPTLTANDWLAWARRAFKQDGDRFTQTYDPALAQGLQAMTPETPLPDLWAEFGALSAKPVMVIRGENSDILSANTVAEMRARHPSLESFEVSGQGHAPLLAEHDVIARIEDFLARNGRLPAVGIA